MNKQILKYFQDKNINISIEKTIESDNYVTFYLKLNDIKKLKSFNKTMEAELTYIFNKSVSININEFIEITINNLTIQNNVNDFLKVKIGKKINGQDLYLSFAEDIHLLIAGATGSGKSVFLNNLIKELISNYSNIIEFAFIDLKKVELFKYNNLSLNITKIANDITEANNLLDSIINIMTTRYEKYQKNNCLNIEKYNVKSNIQDRYLFLVIDEFAELILTDKKNITDKMQSILQLGRASGIRVICATQRPSNDILKGTLKVNFTTRICFKVGNRHDSITILNERGAENLNGKGDGLILKNGSTKLMRFQADNPTDTSYLSKFISYRHKDYNTNKYVKYVIIALILIPLIMITIHYLIHFIIWLCTRSFIALVTIIMGLIVLKALIK